MPRELGTRVGAFFCASALSGAFSGLLAAGISKMDGIGGYAGWRWIFIIEGLITVILGIGCFFLLIDSPQLSTRWLDQDEIRYMGIQQFIKDGGQLNEEQEKTTLKDIWGVMKNWRLYLLAYIMMCQSACNYGALASITLPRLFWALTDFSPNVYRNQVYPPLHNKSHGLPRHQRTTDDSSPLHRRRNIRYCLHQHI